MTCLRILIAKALEVPTPTKDQAKRIHWSESMEQFFVGLMLEQVRKGNKTGPTFKKKTWVVMIAAFNAKFMVHYSRGVLKTRYNILRRHYGNIKTLLGQKGFCWDKGQNKVVADDCVWNAYVKVCICFAKFCNAFIIGPMYVTMYVCLIFVFTVNRKNELRFR